MTYPLLAAALLLVAALAGSAWIFNVLRKRRSEMERRFHLLAKTGQKAAAGGPQASLAGEGEKHAGPVESFFTFGAGYSWGMHASAPLLIAVALVSTAAVAFVCIRGFGLPMWATVAASAAAAFFGPRTVLVRQQQRAMREFGNLFPEAVDMVARLLRAGTPITYAIQVVGEEAGPPVNEVFRMIADQIRIGIPVGEALDMSSKLVALPDFRFFAVAAIMQYSTGGNLVSTLEELSQIMRKRQAARLKARAISAEIRFSAYVLGSLPILVTAALLVIEPAYLAPLFQDPRGHFILALAGAGLLLSFITMRQMIRSVSRE
ncbi:MAG: type II secretion system F family protein [Rhodomicrobium sp.]